MKVQSLRPSFDLMNLFLGTKMDVLTNTYPKGFSCLGTFGEKLIRMIRTRSGIHSHIKHYQKIFFKYVILKEILSHAYII